MLGPQLRSGAVLCQGAGSASPRFWQRTPHLCSKRRCCGTAGPGSGLRGALRRAGARRGAQEPRAPGTSTGCSPGGPFGPPAPQGGCTGFLTKHPGLTEGHQTTQRHRTSPARTQPGATRAAPSQPRRQGLPRGVLPSLRTCFGPSLHQPPSPARPPPRFAPHATRQRVLAQGSNAPHARSSEEQPCKRQGRRRGSPRWHGDLPSTQPRRRRLPRQSICRELARSRWSRVLFAHREQPGSLPSRGCSQQVLVPSPIPYPRLHSFCLCPSIG